MQANIKIVVVHNKSLFGKALSSLLSNLGYVILNEGNNDHELIEIINSNSMPDLIFVCTHLRDNFGFKTMLWLKDNYPSIHVIAVSWEKDIKIIIRIIKTGVSGIVLPTIEPGDLRLAIDSVVMNGSYYFDLVQERLIYSKQDIYDESKMSRFLKLTETHRDFLKLLCTEITYEEIDEQMQIGMRTINDCRDVLFNTLKIKSRVGWVLFAIKNNLSE